MDAKQYAAGFKQLADEAEKLWEQAKKDVEVFQEHIVHWRQRPLMTRKRLANMLRELLGIPGRRFIDVKKQSAKAQRADEADIKELLKNPLRAAQLWASQIAPRRIEPVADKAGLVTIAAFKNNYILSPAKLCVELTTYLTRCPTSPSGTWVWSEIVIECLRKDFPVEFGPISNNDPWAPAITTITACKILAQQIEAAAALRSPKWSQPMQKKEMAERLGITVKILNVLIDKGVYILEDLNMQQTHRMRLDGLAPEVRSRICKPPVK